MMAKNNNTKQKKQPITFLMIFGALIVASFLSAVFIPACDKQTPQNTTVSLENKMAKTKVPDEWGGSYSYTETDKTAGGSAIVITYTIIISEGSAPLGASITSEGYQQIDEREMLCDTNVNGDKIDLFFNSYADGSTTNAFGLELYKKGEWLLSLDKPSKKGKNLYRVTWGKYNPIDERVYFEKS